MTAISRVPTPTEHRGPLLAALQVKRAFPAACRHSPTLRWHVGGGSSPVGGNGIVNYREMSVAGGAGMGIGGDDLAVSQPWTWTPSEGSTRRFRSEGMGMAPCSRYEPNQTGPQSLRLLLAARGKVPAPSLRLLHRTSSSTPLRILLGSGLNGEGAALPRGSKVAWSCGRHKPRLRCVLCQLGSLRGASHGSRPWE